MRKTLKVILSILGGIPLMILIFWICILYTVNYKKTIRETSISPDGKHELLLQSVGEPDWPFGPARGQLVLKEGKKKVSETGFVLRDDGGIISESCWKVTWYEDYVEIILSGKEQLDEQIILYFDGTKEMQQLIDD